LNKTLKENACRQTSPTNLKTKFECGVVVSFDKKGRPFVGFPVSKFPKMQFDKWNEDCQINFGNCRWAKMIGDHEKARMYDILVEQEKEMEMAQEVQQHVEQKKKKTTMLIGGAELEDDENE